MSSIVIDFIKSKGTLPRPKNLHKLIQPFLTYDSFTYTDDKGITNTLTRQDLLDMIGTTCSHCQQYKNEIAALQYQLNNQTQQPTVQVLIKKFIIENYVKTTERLYGRQTLFHEVNEHLQRNYNLIIPSPSHADWRYSVDIARLRFRFCTVDNENMLYRSYPTDLVA
jgi:hypothetical protein